MTIVQTINALGDLLHNIWLGVVSFWVEPMYPISVADICIFVILGLYFFSHKFYKYCKMIDDWRERRHPPVHSETSEEQLEQQSEKDQCE